MGRDHVEIEAKYSVSAESALPSFEDLAGVDTVDPPVSQDLVADYFDTDDLRLARLGITLRRRAGGDDAGWHLKVPVVGARHEAHEPSTPDQAPPGALMDALAGVVRGQQLAPLVTIRTSRVVHRLRDAGGSVLAEIADDRVLAERRTPGDRATAWREWEVELVGGEPALLQRVSRRFETAGALAAANASKLARALGERGLAGVGEPADEGGTPHPARDVVRARLQDQVTQLLRWDVLVRRDVDDSVHQMRVAGRRLRSALATFRPMFDRDRTEPLRAELKWLGSLLGDARDAEVLHDRIGDLAEGEDPRLLDQATIASTQDQLATRYRDNHDRLVLELRSTRYAALVDEMDLLAAEPAWAPGDDDRKVDALRKRVRHDWKRLGAAVASAEGAPDAEARQRGLHDARKAAKRARYAAEPLIPIYGTDAKRFVKAVKKVQTTLGNLNDAIVSMDELQQLAANETTRGHNAFTLGVIHSREQEAADESEARFEKVWRKARRKKVLRWLA
ncbi:CHAD domain-containing protein [Nocardioides immobilis]|uniref:CHAD domain-containing protein n=1 Tax=Nocardioides immobilis TaxID=2049295 RepID=A0A417XSU9_9ACTN|nr:CYTH and CHAD domain-containing protein [Nocardioides immobilis]RHW23423.1 CHAD domain-containing protein [Nocardioides immobilis]